MTTSEKIEAAAAQAARMYAAGMDTTEIDAEVDRLIEQFEKEATR